MRWSAEQTSLAARILQSAAVSTELPQCPTTGLLGSCSNRTRPISWKRGPVVARNLASPITATSLSGHDAMDSGFGEAELSGNDARVLVSLVGVICQMTRRTDARLVASPDSDQTRTVHLPVAARISDCCRETYGPEYASR